jgi:hypothetical protein
MHIDGVPEALMTVRQELARLLRRAADTDETAPPCCRAYAKKLATIFETGAAADEPDAPPRKEGRNR